MNNTLFQPYKLNEHLTLKNRIVMAPMTRNMSHDDFTPLAAMGDYYARRADAGLIITEGTIIRPDARGYSNTPGIYLPSHIEAWKKITDQVHENGGHIFCQIWHVGRISHPHFLNGELPLSPSETMMTSKISRSEGLFYGKSRAVTLEEIKGLIESYAIAAENTIKAGFDGIEIHGANGYLIDQFLHHETNHRADEYGGTPENMARFAIEVVKACGERIGFHRVGLRLSPGAYLQEMVGDPRDEFVFEALLKQLNALPIAYVHTGNFNDKTKFETLGDKTMTSFMRSHYQGILIACGSYSIDEAVAHIGKKDFDLVAIGRPFIANPDLIHKLKNKESLVAYDNQMLGVLY